MRKQKKGFTLIEILLVIAAISILAAIVIVAINPAKQLAEARNAQRKSNVNTILNAIHQYAIDNNGTLPSAINQDTVCSTAGTFTVDQKTICKTGATCTGLTDLSVLTASEKYLVSMPYDPSTTDANKTRYQVHKSANGRVTVCAADTETTWGASVISVSR